MIRKNSFTVQSKEFLVWKYSNFLITDCISLNKKILYPRRGYFREEFSNSTIFCIFTLSFV